MEDPITLPSGSTLILTPASFKQAIKLKRMVCAELAKTDLDLDLKALTKALPKKGDVNLADLPSGVLQLGLDILGRLLASEDLEKQLFTCAAKCLYNSQALTEDTFSNRETWKDFHSVAWEVMKLNVLPFFEGLGFLLSISPQETVQPQK